MNGLRIGTPEMVRWGMTESGHAGAGGADRRGLRANDPRRSPPRTAALPPAVRYAAFHPSIVRRRRLGPSASAGLSAISRSRSPRLPTSRLSCAISAHWPSDGLVQVLDRLLLVGDSGFELFEPFGRRSSAPPFEQRHEQEASEEAAEMGLPGDLDRRMPVTCGSSGTMPLSDDPDDREEARRRVRSTSPMVARRAAEDASLAGFRIDRRRPAAGR